jgi:hypothetical protein
MLLLLLQCWKKRACNRDLRRSYMTHGYAQSWGNRTLISLIYKASRGLFHRVGNFMLGESAFWFSTKLTPTIFCFSSLRKNRIPWNRHVSPAQRRVQDTHRGKVSVLYRFDMHRANCNSGCKGPVVSAPGPVELSVPARKVPTRYGCQIRFII